MKNLLIKWNIFLLSFVICLYLPGYAQKKKVDAGTAIQAGKVVIEGLKFGKKNQNAFNKKDQSKDTAAVLNFNSKNPNEFAASDIQDLSGVWEGEQSNGDLIMYYSMGAFQIVAVKRQL